MSFLEGYLYLQREVSGPIDAYTAPKGEIFNNGRTVDNLYAARAARTLHPSIKLTGLGCDCAAYDVDPNGTARAALAPWDDGTAAAGEFLGPYVMSQTGMDGGHNKRDTLPRAAFPYGANLSPLKPGNRVMEFEVMMFSTTPQGLDYGFDWLESELLTHGCAVCADSTAWLRSACPRTGDMKEYLWEYHDVGLAEGPTWGEVPVEGVTGYMRQLAVTLFAGDPCRWGPRETCLTSVTINTTAQCCTFGSQGRNFHAPTVQINVAAGSPTATTNTGLNIDIWDANGVTGCSTFLGGAYWHTEVNVLPLPQGSIFYIDARQRRVLISLDAGVTWEDGSRYVDSSAGFIDWDSYACRVNDDSVKIILKTDSAPALTMTGTVYSYRRAGC